MKSKKTLMGLSAVLILIFHFYIPISSKAFEICFQKAAYIGVDLFFFLSAISLGKKKSIEYGPFIWNRFKAIYVPYLIFSLIAFIYKKWTLIRFLKVIVPIELFEKGGGAFLWFAPAIMLVYLLVPALLSIKNKLGRKSLILFFGIWLLLVCVINFFTDYTAIFILLNRLPVFFIGLFYYDLFEYKNDKVTIIAFILMFIGLFLIYRYGSVYRLNKPITDIYYVFAILFIVPFVCIYDYLNKKINFKERVFAFIGNFTFELYALQMIFGYDIEIRIMKALKNSPISFYLTAVILMLLAYIAYLIKLLISKKYKKGEKR